MHKVVLDILPLEVERMPVNPKWRARIEFSDGWGRTPLHWAVRRNNARAAKVLFCARVNANAQDHQEWAPLHWGACIPYEKCLQLLLMAKANAIIKDA